MYDSSDKRYSEILDDMLAEVPDHIDKRDNTSFMFMALAPVAKAIYDVHLSCLWTLNQMFLQTQDSAFLLLNAEQYNIYPYPANQATVMGEFDVQVPIGSEFHTEAEQIAFTVIKFIKTENEKFYYELDSTIKSPDANIESGRLIPDDYIPDLTHSRVVELLIPGRTVENIEAFRTRFANERKQNIFGWNSDQYNSEVKKIKGVGQVRTEHHQPTFAGDYDVAVHILNSDNKTPTQALVDVVSDFLLNNTPFTHFPKVFGTQSDNVSVEVKITIDPMYAFGVIEIQAKEKIEELIESINSRWEFANRPLVLRVAQITAVLFEIDGVVDVPEVKINGSPNNFVANGINVLLLQTVSVTPS